MICENCGYEVIDNRKFCSNCGISVQDQTIHPVFEIDQPSGRVLCKSHSNFGDFNITSPTAMDIFQRDKQLTCASCLHYKKDRCYFSKSELDTIIHESDRIRRKYKCQICKSRIHLIFNIVYRIYLERKSDVKVSLICCSCYSVLKERRVLRNQRWYLYSSALWIIAFILILCNPSFFYYFSGNIIFLAFFITLGLITFLLFYMFFIKLIRYSRRSRFIKKYNID